MSRPGLSRMPPWARQVRRSFLHLSGREGGAIQRQQGGEELLRWIPRCTRSVCEGIHCPLVLCEIHVYPSFLFQMAGLRFKCPHIK